MVSASKRLRNKLLSKGDDHQEQQQQQHQEPRSQRLVVVNKALVLLAVLGFCMVAYLWSTKAWGLQWLDVGTLSSLQRNVTISTPKKETQIVVKKEDTHKSLSTEVLSQEPIPAEEEMSVLDYNACCGVGHRLSRMAAAYHASHYVLGFQLKAVWGFCGDTEIFQHLFREETPAELQAYVKSKGQYYRTDGEVGGYWALKHKYCAKEELHAYYKFFAEIMDRYRYKDKIQQYVRDNFDNQLAIGIHVRDGNGEKGDFTEKNRQIGITPEEWVKKVSAHILKYLETVKQDNGGQEPPQPVLFVAADNQDYMGLFQIQLMGQINVVEWSPEQHQQAGTGVFLGQRQEEGLDEDTCFDKWKAMLGDMMLLASTDVLIAGQFSSFSQTMPLNVVLGKPKEQKKVRRPYCEVHGEGKWFDCYEDQMDWCTHAKQFNTLKTNNNPDSKGYLSVFEAMYESPYYRNQTHKNNLVTGFLYKTGNNR
ncbi:expressed unknown protein [Seminavis robusta]|uniref:Uncharacterized protein n=1 Tax=Seminavis robusta TaxID=568900 RepID=A0A9N8E383_9STRA|nr:expressed unknown protein [Seminavis robusta]|eukprot:Sro499_g155060.1 n/a (478) ;mRNA; r:28277-29710